MEDDPAKNKYTAAENFGYSLILFGLCLAVIATIAAIVKGDAIAMVLASFGWFGVGASVLIDKEITERRQ
jgi:vacuolar-type H+-ATPase subunit I/STV1